VGEYEEAIADYAASLRFDPRTPPAVSWVRLAGASFLPAVEAFERVVAEAPGDVSAWRQLGSGNLVLQRWEPAIVALERAMDLAGEEGGLLLALGYAHERKPDT
jgi:tetratricopeptide (TPR) repeat protein